MRSGLRFRNVNAAKRVSYEAGYPADVHVDIPADIRELKTLVRPSKNTKNKTFRCEHPRPEGTDVRDPRGVFKNSVRTTC